jgi:hypothetical protein
MTYENVKTSLLDLNDDALKKLVDSGAKIRTHSQKANSMVFIPNGWLSSDEAVKGMLLYGIRKTVLCKTPTSYSNYQAITNLLETGGRTVDKMKKLLQVLQVD